MPRSDYTNCRNCSRHVSECGELSHERLCFVCGRDRYEENIFQLRAHVGPFALHHARKIELAARRRRIQIEQRSLDALGHDEIGMTA